jgi:hypothetical protein
MLNIGHSPSSIAYRSIKEGIAIKTKTIAGRIVQINSSKVALLKLLPALSST